MAMQDLSPYLAHALLMMAAAIVGGYAGARLARRLPERALRYGIVAVGAVTAALFFLGKF